MVTIGVSCHCEISIKFTEAVNVMNSYVPKMTMYELAAWHVAMGGVSHSLFLTGGNCIHYSQSFHFQ